MSLYEQNISTLKVCCLLGCGVVYQNTRRHFPFFIYTAVKSSNLTLNWFLYWIFAFKTLTQRETETVGEGGRRRRRRRRIATSLDWAVSCDRVFMEKIRLPQTSRCYHILWIFKRDIYVDVCMHIRHTMSSFEMRCWRKMNKVRWTENMTNEVVLHTVTEE